jgi:SAM-dependent methyltransferase
MKEHLVEHRRHPPLRDREKQYIEVPLPLECSSLRMLLQVATGMLLEPFYLTAAWLARTPGVRIHLKCALWGLQLLSLRRLPLRTAVALAYSPMDSTRYFEFHEILQGLDGFRFTDYLDVSSPRIVPLMLLERRRKTFATLVNPDGRDLARTEQLAAALDLKGRCQFFKKTLENTDLSKSSFDLVTCISVLEHIPDDKKAVETMWSLLRPGGRLVLTMPCMARPLEQYISYNEFGTLSPEPDGYTFWQRFYDEKRLRSVVFDITGPPRRSVVYGERRYGLFFRNACAKRLLGILYPFWKEPYMIAREYCGFPDITALPGEGVIILEFVKQ